MVSNLEPKKTEFWAESILSVLKNNMLKFTLQCIVKQHTLVLLKTEYYRKKKIEFRMDFRFIYNKQFFIYFCKLQWIVLYNPLTDRI